MFVSPCCIDCELLPLVVVFEFQLVSLLEEAKLCDELLVLDGVFVVVEFNLPLDTPILLGAPFSFDVKPLSRYDVEGKSLGIKFTLLLGSLFITTTSITMPITTVMNNSKLSLNK